MKMIAMICCFSYFGVKMHAWMIGKETNVLCMWRTEGSESSSQSMRVRSRMACIAGSFISVPRDRLAVNIYVICLFVYVKGSYIWLIIRHGGFDHLRKECFVMYVCERKTFNSSYTIILRTPSLHVSPTIYIIWYKIRFKFTTIMDLNQTKGCSKIVASRINSNLPA